MPRADRHDEPPAHADASKGIGLAVAGTVVAFLATMAWVFIGLLYLFITIYAIVIALGPGRGYNPVVIVVGFVLITSTLAVLLGVTIHLIGRSLTPKRSRSRS